MGSMPTFFPTPADFRNWLVENHRDETELWVGYYKKATGKPSITWPESVDEALCFGWIDGLRKSIDEEAYMIRFTPRKRTSHWSDVNIKRFKELKRNGRIQPAGLAAYKRRKATNSRQASHEQRNAVKLDKAYADELKANKKAWQFFQSLPPSIRKQCKWWIISAKQEKTRQKRLRVLIESSEAGERVPPLRYGKK